MSGASLVSTGTGSGAPGSGRLDNESTPLTPARINANVNPPYRRRMITTLAFPLLMLLAVPYWWYTTSIVRLPLPVDRIAALESANVSRRMSVRA